MSFIKEHKSEIFVVAGALLAGVLSFFITIAIYNPKTEKELSMLDNNVNLNNSTSNEFETQLIDNESNNANDVDYNSYVESENYLAQSTEDNQDNLPQNLEESTEKIALISEPIIIDNSTIADAVFDEVNSLEVSTEVNKTDVETNNEANKNEENEKQELNTMVASNEESNNQEVIEAIGQNATTEKMFPISGDIVLEFAKDKLVYSETLDEWIVHDGIDILGEESEPVKVVEDGIVESVKMDPRYGNTIIVNHGNNTKTVYSNLSTLELVFVGKEVKRGDIISGVGKGFGFESKEGSHVHFEIIKDGECVDPNY